MSARFVYAAFLLGSQVAAFHLYPTVDPDRLAKAFGISADCLTALYVPSFGPLSFLTELTRK